MIVWGSDCRACSNCLFSDSVAGCAGAVYVYSSSYPSGRYLVQFSFFKSNSVSVSVRGNDLVLAEFLPNSTNNPIQHCISTCPSGRVSYYYGAWYNTDENWLPQTNAIIKVFDPITTTNRISSPPNKHYEACCRHSLSISDIIIVIFLIIPFS